MSDIARPTGSVRALLAANAWLVYVFFYAPIILLVVFSFSGAKDPGVWGGFTFDWYRDLADDDRVQNAIGISVRVAIFSTGDV